jgi:hypothetical protein
MLKKVFAYSRISALAFIAFVLSLAAPAVAGDNAVPGQASPVHLPSVTRLGPSDPGGADIFGSNVAIAGPVAVVGAADADKFQGAAYVFERENGVWVERARLVASDRHPFDFSEFGENVKISGNTIAIGAPGDRDETGAVYIYQKTGNQWTEQVKLTANDETVGAFFAGSIALSQNMLVSGAESGLVSSGVEAGAAYVFRRTGNSWTQEAKLIASYPTDQANFGSGAAIINDDTIAVGAGSAQGTGVVYIFKRLGGVWSEQSQLLPSSPEAGQGFGDDIGISGDSLVVGAPFAATTGAAYVYRRAGSAWEEEARLVPPETQARLFATRVAISGLTLVAGAPFTDSGTKEGGSAWVFQRAGNTWVTKAKLKAPDATPNDNFGGYVAIDGKTILIGAEQANAPAGANEGAAYVFDLNGN